MLNNHTPDAPDRSGQLGQLGQPRHVDVSELRAALTAKRDEVLARLAAADAGAAQLRAARGDSDGDDEHDPEGSTVAWDLATQQASVHASSRHLAEVDAALARLDAGWNGTCAGCGAPIAPARLAVRPSAERCVECATQEATR